MSLSNSKEPAPLPGFEQSRRPILRKSAPILNVCVPTNFEKAPLPPTTSRCDTVGSIAPKRPCRALS